MSRLLARRLARRRDGERGFTLIEVIVAIAVLAIAATAVVPLLVAGARTAYAAKLHTQAKNLAQERLERMRSMPFHVDKQNGDFKDMLDTYFVSAAIVPATAGADGYVANGVGSGELPGAYYRYNIPASELAAFPRMKQVVMTQFLNQARQPVAPGAKYSNRAVDTAANGWFDKPASAVVRVMVVTSWTAFAKPRSYVVTTEIADAKNVVPTITTQARAIALRVTSTLPGDVQVTLNVGVISADGSLSTGSAAALRATGAATDQTPGPGLTGATASVAAPPDFAPSSAVTAAAPSCVDVCFGSTSVSGQAVSAVTGLPLVGSAASPVTASVTRDLALTNGVSFSNAPTGSAVDTRLGLVLGQPFVRVAEPSSGNVADAQGYLAATAGSSHAVAAGVSSASNTVELFPVTTLGAGPGGAVVSAPTPLVRIRYVSPSGGGAARATLTCNSSATTPTVTATYRLEVDYWNKQPNGTFGYTTVVIEPGVSDPLATVPLATTQVGPDVATGQPLMLGDYIATWGSLTAAQTQVANRRVTSALPGIVSIGTQPTRPGDATSTMSLDVGRLSCVAEDSR
ncbi:MAG: prepilin-type N-terminal cleavage/methylation domain-containing protein [Frankia sp.]|nr:prepilin-type N-terminal cleavage/methylation domain-containing protein [Frankia sp.]